MLRIIHVWTSDRPRCAIRVPTPVPFSALAPSAGGCDGHLQGLPSIRSLFGHYFPARIFIIFVGLSRVTDDDFFAFFLIGCAGPN
jgi:hypothetical protein